MPGSPSTATREQLGHRLLLLATQMLEPIVLGVAREASPEQREEADRMVSALTRISEQLGAERIARVEEQTVLADLPDEVLDSVWLHLEDDQLSVPGKILCIARVLLDRTAPGH